MGNSSDCYKQCIKEHKEAKKKYCIKRKWWQVLLGYCPWCCRYFRYKVKTIRRNCQYVDERNNWMTACEECRDNDYEYFADLWNTYYSSIW